jgi:peptidoglycan/xylan/chitin deacetylase (PgdA/CDA1 family)
MALYDFPTGTPGRARLGRRSFVVFLSVLVVAVITVTALRPTPPVLAVTAASSPRATASGHTRTGGGDHGGAAAPSQSPSSSASPSSASPAGGTGRGSPSASPSLGPSGPSAASSDPIQRLVDLGLPIFCGAGTKPLVALTFDDGPGILSPEAITQLHRYGYPATFFLVGKLIGLPEFDGIIHDEVKLGAAFGDHTWNHVAMTNATPAELSSEIGRTRRAIAAATHQPVQLFRPPLGLHDATLDSYVQSLGMLEILWSIDSGDSQGANADKIYRTVKENLSNGDIILLHDNRGTTEKALPRILELIRAEGYTPVTVPQLLTMDPPSTAQVRAKTCS